MVIAPILYSARDPGDPGRELKRRPAVVVRAEGKIVVARAVYSRNTEGRGRRLQDPVPAGLAPRLGPEPRRHLGGQNRDQRPQSFLTPADLHLLR